MQGDRDRPFLQYSRSRGISGLALEGDEDDDDEAGRGKLATAMMVANITNTLKNFLRAVES